MCLAPDGTSSIAQLLYLLDQPHDLVSGVTAKQHITSPCQENYSLPSNSQHPDVLFPPQNIVHAIAAMNIAWLLLISTTLVSALQFCQLDVARKTDLCFAITSATNATTGKNDVSINLSVAFKERNGWAGIGIGDKMDGALMFVMYPGENDGGKLVPYALSWGVELS